MTNNEQIISGGAIVLLNVRYDAFLTSVPISVTADVISEGWNGSNFTY